MIDTGRCQETMQRVTLKIAEYCTVRVSYQTEISCIASVTPDRAIIVKESVYHRGILPHAYNTHTMRIGHCISFMSLHALPIGENTRFVMEPSECRRGPTTMPPVDIAWDKTSVRAKFGRDWKQNCKRSLATDSLDTSLGSRTILVK